MQRRATGSPVSLCPGVMASAVMILLAIAAEHPVRAGERGAVCREASVVDEISREVQVRDYYGRVDPRLVTEQPTADTRIVRCAVCVQTAPYDTLRYADRPEGRCRPNDFEVRIVPSGFVVRDLR